MGNQTPSLSRSENVQYHVESASEDPMLGSPSNFNNDKQNESELRIHFENDSQNNIGSTARSQLAFEDYSAKYLLALLRRWSSFTASRSRALISSCVRTSDLTELIQPPRRLHATAWLDGLRGVASLLVLFHHSSWLFYPHLIRGWGSGVEEYSFVQLPIIRIFYASGAAMVAVFFIVSGFSLSYKPLGIIRAGRYPELLDSLSSSVFRRILRLILPPAVTTFGSMLAAVSGFYGEGAGSRGPIRYGTMGENLASWFGSVIELADPFRPAVFPGGYNPTYDTNLWTIPVEINGSMVIFLTLLGISKLQPSARLAVLVCIVLYLLWVPWSHLFLFLSGVLLAELYHIREQRATNRIIPQVYSQSINIDQIHAPLSDSRPQFRNAWTAFWSLNFLIALFVSSMPHVGFGAPNSPGYRTLANWIPLRYRSLYVEDHFWIFLGAFHLVFTISNATFLQSIFTTQFAQYLGKISFALYILHGTFLYTLGWHLAAKVLDYTGKTPGWPYATGMIVVGLGLYPPLFWTADLVARHVDAKSVKFARWLWLKASIPAK